MTGAVIWLLVILGLILVLIFFISWKMSNVMLKPRVGTTEYIYEEEAKRGRLDETFFEHVEKTSVQIKSRYGYLLDGLVLENELTKRIHNSQKVAVICHGYTAGKYASFVYAQMYMELGFSVVVYDHRNHGDSGKAFTTMGYYEMYDLQTVIDWCYERFGEHIQIVTHGESMGAATVLNLLTIDDRIACTVEDCGYSSLKELLVYQIKKSFHLPAFLFYPPANLIVRLRTGVWIRKIEPIRGAMFSRTPILFIHGEKDDFVPCKMAKEMYDARIGRKDIYIAKGAKHAESCVVNRTMYKKHLKAFLNQYYH